MSCGGAVVFCCIVLCTCNLLITFYWKKIWGCGLTLFYLDTAMPSMFLSFTVFFFNILYGKKFFLKYFLNFFHLRINFISPLRVLDHLVSWLLVHYTVILVYCSVVYIYHFFLAGSSDRTGLGASMPTAGHPTIKMQREQLGDEGGPPCLMA